MALGDTSGLGTARRRVSPESALPPFGKLGLGPVPDGWRRFPSLLAFLGRVRIVVQRGQAGRGIGSVVRLSVDGARPSHLPGHEPWSDSRKVEHRLKFGLRGVEC